MPIPESQLAVWSNQGAVVTAKNTHEAIRRALSDTGSLLKGKDLDVYLQGSYKNDTNIRGDSDVDVVVQLNSTFSRDISALPVGQQDLYSTAFVDAAYGWGQFRQDVLGTLIAYFGARNVDEGNKSVKLKSGSGRLAADIVPCLQYRRYLRFRSIADQSYIEGIQFWTRNESRPVVNYPKPHYNNGVVKNSEQRTNGWYKPVVRMFKNARTYLIDHHVVPEDVAPSYFLECLLYNCPDDLFGATYQTTFYRMLDWLWHANPSSFVCQNEQLCLFGNTPEQWSVTDYQDLLRALIALWNGW